MATVDGKEIEIKIRIEDIEDIKRKLRDLGGKEKQRELQESLHYDFPDNSINKQDKVLRIRNERKLTFKGPQEGVNYKTREEIEIEVDGKRLKRIFEGIGLNVSLKNEKYRTEFSFKDGDVTVDETPIGNFIEIEGPKEFIDSMTEKLGYNKKDHIARNYGQLAREYYKKKGIESDGSMVFEHKP